MSNMNSTHAALIDSLNVQLKDIKYMLTVLGDDAFNASRGEASSIGSHVRHMVEFVGAFLDQAPQGAVNYDLRPRNQAIETDRTAAVDALDHAMARLKETGLTAFPAPITMKEALPAAPEGLEVASTIERELHFLHAHTVHHMAIISEVAKAHGIMLDPAFGRAASTLVHEGALMGHMAEQAIPKALH